MKVGEHVEVDGKHLIIGRIEKFGKTTLAEVYYPNKDGTISKRRYPAIISYRDGEN